MGSLLFNKGEEEMNIERPTLNVEGRGRIVSGGTR
jgi:hypothetical protein